MNKNSNTFVHIARNKYCKTSVSLCVFSVKLRVIQYSYTENHREDTETHRDFII